MNCAVCGKPLSGGLDTFGELGAEVCLADYFDPPTPQPKARKRLMDEDFEDEEVWQELGSQEDLSDVIASLEAEIEELEEEIEHRRDDLERKESALWRLRAKPSENAKTALRKWRELAS